MSKNSTVSLGARGGCWCWRLGSASFSPATTRVEKPDERRASVGTDSQDLHQQDSHVPVCADFAMHEEGRERRVIRAMAISRGRVQRRNGRDLAGLCGSEQQWFLGIARVEPGISRNSSLALLATQYGQHPERPSQKRPA